MKNRRISNRLVQYSQSKTGRIIVLTGARQTGKTTLVRRLFPTYEYISVEDPVMRSRYASLTASQWKAIYPEAILDEVQKEPSLIESIKSVYDQWTEPRYILLGSSQILLLEKVKETLAGRSIIMEVYPLTLPELRTTSWEDPVEDSMFQRILANNEHPEFLPSFLLDKRMTEKQLAWDHNLTYGSYPAVSDDDLSHEEKILWLQNYVRTYLERDIRDLASIRDLEPIIKLQRYLAINTGCLINASAIGNEIGVTSKTVQRYLRYFELSYQSVTLPAWAQNAHKRLTRMPKLHYLDNGIIQTVLKKKGGITGNEFESLVIAEIYKQIANSGVQARLYHLRTHDGKEVDLLIEMPDHYLAFEIKMTSKVSKADSKNLTGLDAILDKPVKHSFILSNDPETKQFPGNITAVSAPMFLG